MTVIPMIGLMIIIQYQVKHNQKNVVITASKGRKQLSKPKINPTLRKIPKTPTELKEK